MFKKFLALVLALLMIAAVFVGCGSKKTNLDDETSIVHKHEIPTLISEKYI